MNCNLDEFGALFIREVRDRTIRLFDKRMQGKINTEDSKELFAKWQVLDEEQRALINSIIPDIVDLSLHNILCFFEEHDDIQLVKDGENLNEISDGLAGELYTSAGWIERFSKERFKRI